MKMFNKVKHATIAATVLLVTGLFLFLGPIGGNNVRLECAESALNTSGYVEVIDGKECGVSVESYDEWLQVEGEPKPVKLIGVLLVLPSAVYLAIRTVRSMKNG